MFLKSRRELHFGFKLLFLFWKVPWGPFPRVFVFVNGGVKPKPDAQITVTADHHDTIGFFPKTKERIFEVCAPLYAAGCSLREIQEQTGFAKTSIRESLRSHGYTLRNSVSSPHLLGPKTVVRRSPVLPYGYDWLNGQLILDPREYRVVQKILNLWKAGESSQSIAKILNKRLIAPRNSKTWSRGVVASIVKRHQERGESNDPK